LTFKKSDNQNDKNTIWYRKQGELIFLKIAVKYTRFCFDDRRRKRHKVVNIRMWKSRFQTI